MLLANSQELKTGLVYPDSVSYVRRAFVLLLLLLLLKRQMMMMTKLLISC